MANVPVWLLSAFLVFVFVSLLYLRSKIRFYGHLFDSFENRLDQRLQTVHRDIANKTGEIIFSTDDKFKSLQNRLESLQKGLTDFSEARFETIYTELSSQIKSNDDHAEAVYTELSCKITELSSEISSEIKSIDDHLKYYNHKLLGTVHSFLLMNLMKNILQENYEHSYISESSYNNIMEKYNSLCLEHLKENV